MSALLNTNREEAIMACLVDTKDALTSGVLDKKGAKLTLAALLRFYRLDSEKPSPYSDTPLKEAVVRTGAYYFGPMFVLNKGTSVPSNRLLSEMSNSGFYTESLRHLNNAQLNLFFIMLKCLGLVSDRRLLGYVKYGV